MFSRFTDQVGRSAKGRAVALFCSCVLACACATRGVPAGDATAASRAYVLEHRGELEREIQAGSGEHLYELSRIADCRNLPEFNRALHRRHAEIFPVPPPSDEQV